MGVGVADGSKVGEDDGKDDGAADGSGEGSSVGAGVGAPVESHADCPSLSAHVPAGHAEQPVAPEAAAMVPAAQTVQPLVSVPSVEYCPAGQVPKRRNGADAAVTRSAWPTMGRAPPK